MHCILLLDVQAYCSMQRRAFSLAPFSDSIRQTLERGDASCIQVEIFRQAEEKKAMSQTGTKEDLEEITNRLQGMNVYNFSTSLTVDMSFYITSWFIVDFGPSLSDCYS